MLIFYPHLVNVLVLLRMFDWKCKLCAFCVEDSSKLINHYVNVHVPQCRSVHLPCIYPTCVELSPTLSAWKAHRSRCHLGAFAVHSNFVYYCHVSNCNSSFSLAAEFLKHLRCQHLALHQTVACPFRTKITHTMKGAKICVKWKLVQKIFKASILIFSRFSLKLLKKTILRSTAPVSQYFVQI